MGRDMVLGPFTIAKEVNMWEIGWKTKCMEKELCIILIKKLPTKGTGKTISFLDMELCIIKKSLL